MRLPIETVRKYLWVNDIEAWTVAVISGPAAREVIRIYGGDPAEPMIGLRFAELDDLRVRSDDAIRFHLQVTSRAGVVVAVENDGYSGAFPEIARRCSANGGSFMSVYWNIHAAGNVTQAVDGVIVASFEPLYPLAPDEGQWERRPEWAIGPEVELGLTRQVCMAQLEQQTGVEVRQSWLSEPSPTFRVPEPYFLYRDVEGADRI